VSGPEQSNRRPSASNEDSVKKLDLAWFRPDIFALFLTAFATFGILFANVAFAYFSYWQLRAISDQSNEIKVQASAAIVAANGAASAADTAAKALQETKNEASSSAADFSEQLSRLDSNIAAQLALARATQDSVLVANKAYRQGQESLAEAEQHFVLEQRPWVGAIFTDQSPGFDAKTGELRLFLDVQNQGRTPAHDVLLSGRWFIGLDSLKAIDAFFKTLTLKPAAGGQRYIILPGKGEHEEIRTGVSDDQREYALTGDYVTFVAMRIWYRDVFNNQYSVDYCSTYLETYGGWTTCPRHNEEHSSRR
jgi:hypothetical protein